MKTIFFNRLLLVSVSISWVACVIIITTLFMSGRSVCAQTGCSGTLPPVNLDAAGQVTATYPRGATVVVSMSGLSSEQQRQVNIALENMNTNNRANGSNVQFVGHGSGLPGANGQYTLTIQNGSLDTGTVAQLDAIPVGGQITSATMTFNTGAATHDGQPGSSPYYVQGADGYDTVFIKKTLHELGHAMGLGDSTRPQTAGNSIMNTSRGPNCQNDVCNNQATSVQPCDNAAIQYHQSYQEPIIIDNTNDCSIYPNAPGCSLVFNDGGYGSNYCTPYFWVVYTSYDGGKTWQFDYVESYAGCW